MIINIQFLRFFAAMMVVIYHASDQIKAVLGSIPELLYRFSDLGFAGVDMFFVISGFIMVHTLQQARSLSLSIRFLKRRFSRIYSGYWPFFLIAYWVLSWTHANHFAESNLLLSFLLLPQSQHGMLLVISWTLVYELYFYLLFSIIALLQWNTQKYVYVVLLIFIISGNLYREIIMGSYSPDAFLKQTMFFHFFSSPVIAEFFAGALVACWVNSRNISYPWLFLLSGLIGFIAADYINVNYFSGNIEWGYYTNWRVLLFGGSSILTVIGLVVLEKQSKQLPEKLSRLLGSISYSIYLSHLLILALIQKLLSVYIHDAGPLFIYTTYGVSIVLIVGYSYMHYRVIEFPLNKIFIKLSKSQ